jgi:methionyl-tRNA synthetase
MNIPDIQNYINTIYEFSQQVNKYITHTEPWILIKKDMNRFYEVRYNMYESLRIISLLLSPILIEKTKIILEHLQINLNESELEYGYFTDKHKIKIEIKPLFNKN